MNRSNSKQNRILAISPSNFGFGFAVLEGKDTLVDWGMKKAKGDKNAESLKKIEQLVELYSPGVIVLQDLSDSRRSSRTRQLVEQIVSFALIRKIQTSCLSWKNVMQEFFVTGRGTKHEMAEKLVAEFPEELGSRLPPKRRAWMSEDCRMSIFEAVALARYFRIKGWD